MTEFEKIEKVLDKFFLDYEDLELSLDTHLYTQSEWNERGEIYLNSCPAVLTFEGPLYQEMNYSHNFKIAEDLRKRLNEIGYYYELGYAWCMGFYK